MDLLVVGVGVEVGRSLVGEEVRENRSISIRAMARDSEAIALSSQVKGRLWPSAFLPAPLMTVSGASRRFGAVHSVMLHRS